jgi:hypothetical protein
MNFDEWIPLKGNEDEYFRSLACNKCIEVLCSDYNIMIITWDSTWLDKDYYPTHFKRVKEL